MTKFVSHVIERKPDQFKQAVLSHLKASIYPKLEQMKQEIGASMFKGKQHVTEGYGGDDNSLARELVLFATNDRGLYRQMIKPIINNLVKKKKKGIYDKQKALKAWKNLADAAAKEYAKQFGSGPQEGFKMFSPQVRKMAANALAGEYEEEIEFALNEGNKSVPARIKSDIEKTAKAARRAGDKVEINYRLPTVSVKVGNDEYFFQGNEASDLLDDVPDNVDDEDYILWVAQGW